MLNQILRRTRFQIKGLVVTMVRRVEGISSPLQAKLEAACGVLLAREIGAAEVELEGDTAMVLSAINMLVDDCEHGKFLKRKRQETTCTNKYYVFDDFGLQSLSILII
ncbi:hypothetical protein ACFX1Q_000098 [Malus domestica]